LLFSKAGAKVLLIFDMRKYKEKKMYFFVNPRKSTTFVHLI